MGSLVNYLVR
ncbi:hypothetical protein LINPERPRIM_LOCUS7612 [Linum perenne]